MKKKIITAGVDEKYRAKGVGGFLYLKACKKLRELGAKKIRAIIHDEDEMINSLYGRLGFVKQGQYQFRNTTRNVMILDFNDKNSVEKFEGTFGYGSY